MKDEAPRLPLRGRAVKTLLLALTCGLLLLLGLVVTEIPLHSQTLEGESRFHAVSEDAVDKSGVGNPVTAVLSELPGLRYTPGVGCCASGCPQCSGRRRRELEDGIQTVAGNTIECSRRLWQLSSPFRSWLPETCCGWGPIIPVVLFRQARSSVVPASC
jgi:hypothetical protein